MFGWLKRFLIIDEYARGKEAAARFISENPDRPDLITNWNLSFFEQGEFERGWQEVLRPHVEAVLDNDDDGTRIGGM